MVMTAKSKEPPTPIEVRSKATRRRFTAAFKLEIVRRADDCKEAGGVEAMLRREGIYSSQLCAWRKLRASGALNENSSNRRGPKPRIEDPRDREIAAMKKEIVRLEARARRAEALVELQKKVGELLDSMRDDETAKKR